MKGTRSNLKVIGIFRINKKKTGFVVFFRIEDASKEKSAINASKFGFKSTFNWVARDIHITD